MSGDGSIPPSGGSRLEPFSMRDTSTPFKRDSHESHLPTITGHVAIGVSEKSPLPPRSPEAIMEFPSSAPPMSSPTTSFDSCSSRTTDSRRRDKMESFREMAPEAPLDTRLSPTPYPALIPHAHGVPAHDRECQAGKRGPSSSSPSPRPFKRQRLSLSTEAVKPLATPPRSPHLLLAPRLLDGRQNEQSSTTTLSTRLATPPDMPNMRESSTVLIVPDALDANLDRLPSPTSSMGVAEINASVLAVSLLRFSMKSPALEESDIERKESYDDPAFLLPLPRTYSPTPPTAQEIDLDTLLPFSHVVSKISPPEDEQGDQVDGSRTTPKPDRSHTSPMSHAVSPVLSTYLERTQHEFPEERAVQQESLQEGPLLQEPMQPQSLPQELMIKGSIREEAVRSDPMQTEPIQTEPTQTGPMQTEPGQREPCNRNRNLCIQWPCDPRK